jgi:hypothetical protein
MTFFLQTNREKYCTDIDDDVLDFDSSRFWRPIADWLFENKHFIEIITDILLNSNWYHFNWKYILFHFDNYFFQTHQML